MKKNEEQVETKNTELSLAFLKNKVNEESKKLTELYTEKIILNDSIKESKSKFEKDKAEIAEGKKVLADERLSLSLEKKNVENLILRASEEKKTIDRQRNEAMKELSKINDWILTAENKKKELENSIKSLDEQVSEKQIIVADIEEIKIERTNENIKLSQTKLEINSMVREADSRVDEADRQVKEKEARGVEINEANEKAQEALDNKINERLRIEHDLEIYIKRVEEKFKEAFPNLKMNL